MKKLLPSILPVLCVLILLFTGCATTVPEPTRTRAPALSTEPLPTADPTRESTEGEGEQEYALSDPKPLGSLLITAASQRYTDKDGIYRHYEGGEMVLPFSMLLEGEQAAEGIGLLLFLDGQPQPYKNGPDGESAYLHTYYPEPGSELITDLVFTPVAGKAGDTLEFYAMALPNPGHIIRDMDLPYSNTHGAVACGFRLKFRDDPPEQQLPAVGDQLQITSVSHEDLTDEDRMRDPDADVNKVMYLNGESEYVTTTFYEITPASLLDIRVEVWGASYLHYSLVFYVDNVPACPFTQELILPDQQDDRKTVVRGTLCLPDFDGESIVYAVLVPRDYYIGDIDSNGYVQWSRTFYLLEEKAP